MIKIFQRIFSKYSNFNRILATIIILILVLKRISFNIKYLLLLMILIYGKKIWICFLKDLKFIEINNKLTFPRNYSLNLIRIKEI
jgi:hypothetical protein